MPISVKEKGNNIKLNCGFFTPVYVPSEGGGKLYRHKVKLRCDGSAVGFGDMHQFCVIFYSNDNTPITRDIFLNYLENLPKYKNGTLFYISEDYIKYSWGFSSYGSIQIGVYKYVMNENGGFDKTDQIMDLETFKLFLPEIYQGQSCVVDEVSEIEFSLFTQIE